MTFSYKKRGYLADAIQYDGTNFSAVSQMLHAGGASTNYHNEHEIMVRMENGIETLHAGDWVVTGENGQIKIYNSASFHIKYEMVV